MVSVYIGVVSVVYRLSIYIDVVSGCLDHVYIGVVSVVVQTSLLFV